MPPRRVTSGWPPTTPNVARARGYGSALTLPAWTAWMRGAVTGEQMRALFGAGMHPLATHRLERLGDADLTDANVWAATRLGLPFKVSVIAPGRFVPGIYQVRGYDISVRDGSARRSGQLSGGCL